MRGAKSMGRRGIYEEGGVGECMPAPEVGTAANKGNPVGGRWARAKKDSKIISAEYDQCVGDPAKARYRQEWAKKQWNIHVKEFIQIKKEVRESWKRSTYMPVGRMAVEEGGGKAGWLQASRYAFRCMCLGPPWVRYDDMTESLRFLYIVEGLTETFSKEWAIHEKFMATTSVPRGAHATTWMREHRSRDGKVEGEGVTPRAKLDTHSKWEGRHT